MKHLSLIILSLLTITAHSDELSLRERINTRFRSTADRWAAENAEAQLQGNAVFEMAAVNAPLITPNSQINCNVRQASLGEGARGVKMKFKDGQEETFIAYGVQGILWTDRKLKVVKLENGKLVPSLHHLVWGRTNGGWRFERQPELAKSCPRCDRFGNVESWSIVPVDLHSMAGCASTDRPLINQTPPTGVVISDTGESSGLR